MILRLGRRAIRWDSRRLKLSNYLSASLPEPPASCDWTKGTKYFGMMCNDQLGCCTISGVGHTIQLWTANTGTMATIPDSDILSYYEKWDGYNPSDPDTDQGGIEADVLTDWRNQSFAGHKLDAFMDPDHTNLTEIKQTIYLFGGCYIGMEVPNFIMQDVPEVWDVVADDGGIDGGHCVAMCGYDSVGPCFVSWGSVYKMTWAYWNKYVDEAHALLSEEWIASTGLAPSQLNLSQLKADLAAIK